MQRHNNEWCFVIEDVVSVLMESNDPKQYIQRMKQRDSELAKGLKRENLWDHMMVWKSLFLCWERPLRRTLLRLSIRGLDENKQIAKRGGDVAGIARERLEKETDRKVVSQENYYDS